MNVLNLTVSSRRTNCGEVYEGVVSIDGLVPTKLAKTNGDTYYTRRSSLTQSAQNLARKLNYKLVTSTKTAAAAKRSCNRS